MFDKLEEILEWGGTRKDICFLVISAIALVASFVSGGALPVDPAWVAIVLCGLPIVCEAIIGLVTAFDIKADVLVAMALIASIIIGEYFAAGEVALIMQLGGLLEELTVNKAQKGIQRLVDMTPRMARVVSAEGIETECDAESVQVGQLVRILPGETIPVDGRIVQGSTSVDEAVITGESMPADKQPGDEVSSGTINQFGSIDVEATRIGSDGSIQRMARLVKSADAGKAPIVRMADRWATWVVIGALTAAVAVYLVTGEILRSVTVLVVFCPCSLVLATPTAIMASIGNATKHGFLVKEGDAIEKMAKIKQVVFDKTGTLTKGKPHVAAVLAHPISGLSDQDLFALVASAETRSEHPLGKAIVFDAKAGAVPLQEVQDFEMVPGQGISATVEGQSVLAGNLNLMGSQGLTDQDWADQPIKSYVDEGCSITYVCIDGKAAGFLALSDTLRPESEQMVSDIKQVGVKPVLLTGDNQSAASTIASRVGIESYRAQCRPEDKMEYIESVEAQGSYAAMVGDGANDAPALKRSYVGIAMGGIGSDIAIDAADIAIVEDSVAELPHLIALSQHTMRVIKANLTFSMTLNFVAIVLALTAVLDPVSGALVHNCGSVFVIVNSSFLLNWARKQVKS